MAGYNRIIMVGNLTRDPELKQFESASGTQSLCKLGIASNRTFKNRQTGINSQEVCFVDVDVWGQQGENCNQYLSKGRPVLVEGRLKLDTWETDGQARSRHSIVADRVVFLGAGGQAQSETSEPEFTGSTRTEEPTKQAKKAKKENSDEKVGAFKDAPPFEDELPF